MKKFSVLFLICLWVAQSVFAQTMTFQSRLASKCVGADMEAVKQAGDQLYYSLTYMNQHVKNANDRSEKMRMYQEGNNQFFATHRLPAPQTPPQFPNLDDLIGGGKMKISAAGLEVAKDVSTAIKTSTTYAQFVEQLTRITESSDYQGLDPKEKKEVSNSLMILDYCYQALEANNKANEVPVKSIWFVQTPPPSVYTCVLSIIGGGLFGGFTGSVLGPGGTAVGAAAGAIQAAYQSC